MKINIIYFEDSFHENAFNLMTKAITQNQTILISGGNSIKHILNKKKNKITISKNKTIILSDERLYFKINDVRTNYSNLKKNLFTSIMFLKLNFIYFNLGQHYEIMAEKFFKEIKYVTPEAAILSLGSDGHICSIFKDSENINLNKYIDVVMPSNKINRVTLNIKFLEKIKKIYLIVNGSNKGHVLNNIINGKKSNFPLKLSKKIIFVLDKAAFQKMKKNKDKICLKNQL